MPDQSSPGGSTIPCCAFCGKSRIEVNQLIAGPSVHICGECVRVCHDILHAEPLNVTIADFERLRSAYESDPTRIQ